MASAHDMKTATSTYHSFIKAATWGAAACAVVAAIVVGLIAS